MSHLLLTVRFLDARYHGQADGGRREWPPSPMRLFSALLAGAKADWSDARERAFRWLERQPAPVIQAMPVQEGSRLLTYVPNNNSDSNNKRIDKEILPTLLGDPPEVNYLWSVPADEESLAEVIAEAVRHIRALGWGIDLAVGRGSLVDRLPSREGFEVFKPRRKAVGGGRMLRIPIPGSLDALESAFQTRSTLIREDGSIHDESTPAVFGTAAYALASDVAFCAFQLETPDEESYAWNPRQLRSLVGMVRHVAAGPEARHALEPLGIDLDAFVHGHSEQPDAPRLSIVPIPSIGHPHSDGLIRRVFLVEPMKREGTVSQALEKALHGLFLQPEPGDDTITAGCVCLGRLSPSDRFLRRYTHPASTWASVTPVLLPGFDERKSDRGNLQKRLERAEQLVCKALVQSGIDVPASIELSRVPYWPGSMHVRDYQPREKLAHYPRWHVRLHFERPWAGPLVLGAGRYSGFGIFASQEA